MHGKWLSDRYMYHRYLDEREHGPRKRRKMGRKPIISDDVISNAQGVAEVNDLSKDSATSSLEILRSIDHFRRSEQDEAGANSLSCPTLVSPSTSKRAVRRVAPVIIPRGGVQNTSRKKALLDPRNALSCAATWNAVVDGIDDSRQIHSWDELSVELNGFGKKVRLYMTKKGSNITRKRNLTPATTRNQGKRRTFKMGISKFVDILHHIAKEHELITNYLTFFTDTNAEGEIECVIAMIKDDNFKELKSYKVKQIHYL